MKFVFVTCDFRVLTKVLKHHEKTPIYFKPLKPHFYIVKTGVYRGILYFSYIAQKRRLWVLVRTASPRRL